MLESSLSLFLSPHSHTHTHTHVTNTHRCQHTHAHGTTLVSGENVKTVCQWCWHGWHILHRVQYTLCLGDKRVAAEHQNWHYLSPARWICWASSDWINANRNNYYQARFQVSVTLVTLKKIKKLERTKNKFKKIKKIESGPVTNGAWYFAVKHLVTWRTAIIIKWFWPARQRSPWQLILESRGNDGGSLGCVARLTPLRKRPVLCRLSLRNNYPMGNYTAVTLLPPPPPSAFQRSERDWTWTDSNLKPYFYYEVYQS